MVYREFFLTDITSVRDILEKDLGYNVEVSELSDRVSEMLKRGNYHIFVACDNEKVIGFIGFVTFLAFEIKNECMKIIALAVSDEYRNKGIGTALVKEAEKFAENNNIEIILVNSGLYRENAHKFYEAKGFIKKSYGFIKKM